MPDLTKNEDGSPTDLAQNYRKTRDTTNLGTRKLAFYTFAVYGTTELVDTKDDSNGLYSQIVQTLQQAGVELYWLGQPHSLGESFIGNWDFLNFYDEGNPEFTIQAFMFAMQDDADSPITVISDTNFPYGIATATLTNDYDPNWITFDGGFNNDTVYTGMPIVFSGSVFGGIVAGKTYYVKEYDNDGPNLVIRLSETIDTEVLDIQFPAAMGGEPGPVFELTSDSGTMSARIDWLDTQWQGTAGDYSSGCCADMTYPNVVASRLGNFIYDRIGGGTYWVERCMPNYGIFPAWWAN